MDRVEMDFSVNGRKLWLPRKRRRRELSSAVRKTRRSYLSKKFQLIGLDIIACMMPPHSAHRLLLTSQM
jgi:hypothetical protein